MPFKVPKEYVHLAAVLPGLSPAVLRDLEQWIADIEEKASAKINKIKQILAGDVTPQAASALPEAPKAPVPAKAEKPVKKAVKQAGKKQFVIPNSINGRLLLLEEMAGAEKKEEAFTVVAEKFGLPGKNRNYVIGALLGKVVGQKTRPVFIKETLESMLDKNGETYMLKRLAKGYKAVLPDDNLSPEALLAEAKGEGYVPKKK